MLFLAAVVRRNQGQFDLFRIFVICMGNPELVAGVFVPKPWLLVRSSVLHISSLAKVRFNSDLVNLLSLCFGVLVI